MTDYMEAVSDPDSKTPKFDYAKEQEVFAKTFRLLNNCLQDRAFGRAKTDGIGRNFSVYHFEAFTLGIQKHLNALNPGNSGVVAGLKAKIETIKRNPDFVALTSGGGKNSPGPLNDRITFVERGLA